MASAAVPAIRSAGRLLMKRKPARRFARAPRRAPPVPPAPVGEPEELSIGIKTWSELIRALFVFIVCRFTEQVSRLESVSEPRIRCWILCRLGTHARKYCGVVYRGLFVGPKEARVYYAHALAALGAQASWALSVAVECAKLENHVEPEREREFGGALALYLQQQRPKLNSHVADLAASRYARVRIVAARALGDATRGRFPFARESELLLADPDLEIVKVAADALRGAGESAKPALPFVVAAWRRLAAEYRAKVAASSAQPPAGIHPWDASDAERPLLSAMDMLETARDAVEPDLSQGFAEMFAERLAHWETVGMSQQLPAFSGMPVTEPWESDVSGFAWRVGKSRKKNKRLSGSLLGEVLKILARNEKTLTEAVIYFLDALIDAHGLGFEIEGHQQRADANLLVGELGLLVLGSQKQHVTQRLGRILSALE